MNFFQRLIGRPTPPRFLKEIIEGRLKRKIISFESLSSEPEFLSYSLLTTEGYFDFRASTNKARLETEKAVLALCRKKLIPVPKVVLNEILEINRQPYEFMVEKIKGEPLTVQKIHIFDYNQILSNFAEILWRLHSIQLENFGPLEPNLRGRRGNWRNFFNQDLDIQLETIRREKVLKPSVVRFITQILTSSQLKINPILLHGHISSKVIYINNKLKIANLAGFSQPLSGDPNYEMAGFLIYEGFDRAKRLIRPYRLLGGLVEWDSPEFLRTSLRRVIGLLYWKAKAKQEDKIYFLKEMVLELITKYQSL